jgi:hypothetical protein
MGEAKVGTWLQMADSSIRWPREDTKMDKTVHIPTPTLLPIPVCDSTVCELFILLLEVSVGSVLVEKECKPEIGHGGGVCV